MIIIPEEEKGYKCEIILDSVNVDTGTRLTTFCVKYPLFVHQDFIRHRALSRSVASNRAIPTKRYIQTVLQDPVYPLRWGKAQPGMSPSSENFDGEEAGKLLYWWDQLRDDIVEGVENLSDIGLAKQWANRPLYAFQWVVEVLTATDWCNLFTLRIHSDAQDELQKIVGMMGDSYLESNPQNLCPGEWHIPFIREEEIEFHLYDRLRISAARAARTSYRTHEGKISLPEEDYKLFDRLITQKPVHSSPTEHQACAMKSNKVWVEDWTEYDLEELGKVYRPSNDYEREKYYANFCGFLPFRMTIPENTSREFTHKGIKIKDWDYQQDP